MIVCLLMLCLGTSVYGQGATPAASCENLAKLSLPDTTITLAQVVEAGQFPIPTKFDGPPPNPETFKKLPAMCRIAATLKPSSDSNIRIEVWMPMSGWNGKFFGAGNGGWAGRIPLDMMTEALLHGYATGGTDSGHDNLKPEEYDGKFIPGHPEKTIDYGYRAVHLMSVESQQIVKTFYNAPIKYRYYFGESRGGYEAITEANRFPEDYDAISAGWPPNPFVLFNAQQIWADWLIVQKPERLIPKEKYEMIHTAVLNLCDELDGVKDGMIAEPDKCPFEPKSLLCKGGDAPDCLTAPQVELLEKTYQGPTNPRTGEVYYPGPAKGAELEMFREASGEARGTPLDMYRYVVFPNSNWDWKKMDWDKDIATAIAVTKPMLLTEPNFSAFINRGGKILLYVSWLNFHSPMQVIDFANQAGKLVGPEKAAQSIRVITTPGNFEFDRVKVIEDWAERGKAPEEVVGTQKTREGKLIRTRPLCAYPRVAKYKGTGNTDDAANFYCAEEKSAVK
jgi:feruloyl esterase